MSLIVLVPTIKIDSKAFGRNYTKWEKLARLGLNSWNSAVNQIVDADEVILFHCSVRSGNGSESDQRHQAMEFQIIRKAIEIHDAGHDLLLLEADTLCVSQFSVHLFGLKHLTLFSPAYAADDESIPADRNLNSGVIYWPHSATAPRQSLADDLRDFDNWPKKWAYYQNIWVRAFYSQFRTLDEGWNYLNNSGLGRTMNFFPVDGQGVRAVFPSTSGMADAKVIHLFTSRSVGAALSAQRIAKSFGMRGLSMWFLIRELLPSRVVNHIKNFSKTLLNRRDAL